MSASRGSAWLCASAVIAFCAAFAAGRGLSRQLSSDAASPVPLPAAAPPVVADLPARTYVDPDSSRVWALIGGLESGAEFCDFGAFRGADLDVAISYWLEVDAEAAARAALASSSYGYGYAVQVFEAWTRRDPEAALEFVRAGAGADGIEIPLAVENAVLNGLGLHHPERFFETWARFSEGCTPSAPAVEEAFAWLWGAGTGRALETFYALSPKQQKAALSGLLKSWAAVAPDAALAWIDENQLDDKALAAAIEGIANVDPVRALAVAAESKGGAAGMWTTRLDDALLRYTPSEIESLARENRDLDLGFRFHLAGRAEELAATSLPEAFALIDGLESEQFRGEVAGVFGTGFEPDAESLAPFLAWVARRDSERLRSERSVAFWALAAFKMGDASVYQDVLGQLPPGPLRDAVAAGQVADDGLRSGDPTAFLAWYDWFSWATSHSNPDAERTALERLESVSREAALDLAARLESYQLDERLGNWFDEDPSAALAWAAAKEPEGLKVDPVRTMAHDWAYFDPRAASEWSTSLPDGRREVAAAAVASTWASSDPAEALGWAESLAEPGTKAAALSGLAQGWFDEDEIGATAWLSSLAPGYFRDRAIAGAVGKRHFASGDDYLPLRWAAAIGDLEVRLDCLRSMTGGLSPGQLVSEEVLEVFVEAGVPEGDIGTLQAENPVIYPDPEDLIRPDGTFDPFGGARD